MKRFLFFAICLGVCFAGAAAGQDQADWTRPDAWYSSGREVCATYADVFYVVSTSVFQSPLEAGHPTWRAALTARDRAEMDREFAFVCREMFPDSLNFFAPYYHQFTMDALHLPEAEFSALFREVEAEVCAAFDAYMAHWNGGRPFVLAGFSQGGMLVKSLLRHLDDRQADRLIAAYVIGEEVTRTDLSCPRIRPATGATDTGITISFNSVTSLDAVWPVVAGNPATCINPLNWCTDDTPAPLFFGGDTLSVSVHPDKQVLVVSGLDEDKYPEFYYGKPWVKGNLHIGDLLFYAPAIGQNAKQRIYHGGRTR